MFKASCFCKIWSTWVKFQLFDFQCLVRVSVDFSIRTCGYMMPSCDPHVRRNWAHDSPILQIAGCNLQNVTKTKPFWWTMPPNLYYYKFWFVRQHLKSSTQKGESREVEERRNGWKMEKTFQGYRLPLPGRQEWPQERMLMCLVIELWWPNV